MLKASSIVCSLSFLALLVYLSWLFFYMFTVDTAMDPLTITATVVKLTATCLSIVTTLYAVRTKYVNAPISFVAICSETSVISTPLLLLDALSRKGDYASRPELSDTLDTALIGCTVLFSCLEDEITHIKASSPSNESLSWKGKAKAVWNHDRIQELLVGLRGQQTGISLLIQLLQLDSLGEIKQIILQNQTYLVDTIQRTRSLRLSHPAVNVPASIYSNDDCQSVYSYNPSIAGDSTLEFDFDDLVINSKVYRQVLKSAQNTLLPGVQQYVEGDLIDLPDSQTVRAVEISQTFPFSGTILSNLDGR